jgi:hypothetical protein
MLIEDSPMRNRARDMGQGYDEWAARVEVEEKDGCVDDAGDDESPRLRYVG